MEGAAVGQVERQPRRLERRESSPPYVKQVEVVEALKVGLKRPGVVAERYGEPADFPADSLAASNSSPRADCGTRPCSSREASLKRCH